MLAGDPPQWEIEETPTLSFGHLNLAAQLRLTEILSAHSLALGAQGAGQEALRVLRAASRLNRALYDRGEMGSTLVAVACSRYQLGTLRRIAAAGAGSLDALGPLPARHAVRRGYVSQAAAYRGAGSSLEPSRVLAVVYVDSEIPTMAWLLYSVMGPLARYAAIDAVGRSAGLIASLDDLDACRVDPDVVDAAAQGRLPEWQVFGKSLVVAPYARAARLDLDLEFTRLILELRDRRRSDGAWPATLAAAAVRACPGRRWEYQVWKEGRMRVALAGEKPWQPRAGLWLPLEHVAGGATGGERSDPVP